jgi:hypothetical protein
MQLIQTLLEGWIGAIHNLSALDAATARDAESANDEPAAVSASNPYSSKEAEPQNRSWQF